MQNKSPRLSIKRAANAVSIALFGVLLTACNDTEVSQPEKQVIKPAFYEVASATTNESLTFNGIVQSSERAELSFRVSGQLVAINVKEGDYVQKGQLLAALESGDAEIALQSAKVELSNIDTEYKRAKALFDGSKAISASQLDEISTRLNLAKNKEAEAERQLGYTKIVAPFDGIIGRKYIDNYTQIQPNEPVFTLHNPEELEVEINIPDTVMASESNGVDAIAEITSIPDHEFKLSLKAYSTHADDDTQTYSVLLSFSDVGEHRVLPGMTAKVKPVQNTNNAKDLEQIYLPLTAVVPDNKGNQFVWVIGADNTLEKRFVSVGELNGKRVAIESNLKEGEKVVIAGLSALLDGMQVRPVENTGAK